MAGRLFDVFSTPRWSSVPEECPADMSGATIVLKSSDDEIYELPGEAACLSGVIRRSIDLRGPEVEIDTMLPKSSLGKLVEYMKHHKDTPPADIQVPLVGDNLVDSGASKWDASFINVEKDVLFELLMAANCMDIPSLEILAAAKAFLTCKGKTSDKLRKDAGMDADLPEAESAQLTGDYLDARRDVDPEEAHVATLAVVMQGMVKAAEKHGLYYLPGDSVDATAPSTDLKSFRAWSWQAAVANDWKQLAKAPEQVRSNRDLVIEAIRQSHGAALSYASRDLLSDREVILAAVRHGLPDALAQASEKLRSSQPFVMEAVKINGEALAGANEAVRGDKEVLLEAARCGCGSAMKGATDRLQSDKRFALDCCRLAPEAYKYISPVLQSNREFALEVLRKNGLALQYMSAQFRADRELLAVAVANNPEALAFGHTSARADLGKTAPWDPQPSKQAGAGAGTEAAGPRQLGLTSQAREQGEYYLFRAHKSVQFSALSSFFANMGQGNYVAANMALDKYPFYQRPEIDAVTVMWGAVGAIGMRWKAFASQDFLNSTPEILMGVEDCCKVLHLLCTKMDTPEWTSASLNVDPSLLAQTAGVRGGQPGYRGETASVTSRLPRRTQVRVPKIEEDVMQEKIQEDVVKEAPQEAGPLGGWPKLATADTEEIVARDAADLQLLVGARVRLTGLQAKNGMTGVVQQHYPDSKGGKWKVSLDHNGGSTQLRACYLEVVAPPVPN